MTWPTVKGSTHDKYHQLVYLKGGSSMTTRRELTVVDGRPTWHYISDGHVVMTGPVVGQVVTDDGTVYDVTPDVIEVQSDHAGEVAHHIGLRYQAEGHAAHTSDVPFVHECTATCKPAKAGRK